MAKIIKNMTVLERYYGDGFLDLLSTGEHTAEGRYHAGTVFAKDAYLSRISNLKSTDPAIIRVDGSGGGELSEKALFHRDRYNKALRAVPHEFLAVVTRVCVDDLPIAANDNGPMPARRKSEMSFSLRLDLVRGLDRLIDFYRTYAQEQKDD